MQPTHRIPSLLSRGQTRYLTVSTRQHVAQRAAPTAKTYNREATRQNPPAPIEPATTTEPPPPTNDARFGPRDPERGRKAMEEVARGGKLDPRYQPAARRVLAIICAIPVVIVIGYELFQRRFKDKHQKQAAA